MLCSATIAVKTVMVALFRNYTHFAVKGAKQFTRF